MGQPQRPATRPFPWLYGSLIALGICVTLTSLVFSIRWFSLDIASLSLNSTSATAVYLGSTDVVVAAWALVLLMHWSFFMILCSIVLARNQLTSPVWSLVSFSALLASLLAFIAAVAHASATPLEWRGAWIHAAVSATALVVLLLCEQRRAPPHNKTPRAPATNAPLPRVSDTNQDPWFYVAVVSLLPIAAALVMGVGCAAQAVVASVRVTPEITRFQVGLPQLFVNCTSLSPVSNNNTAGALFLIGHIDHTASFYAPLLDALAMANVPACAYDPAGSGFSDAGTFPRSAQVLANELSALLDHPTALWGTNAFSVNKEVGLFVAGFGWGGFVARLVTGMRPDVVSGVALVDAMSEWDAQYIGSALGVKPKAYVESVIRDALAKYSFQRSLAPVGECLLYPFPLPDPGSRFPALPPGYAGNQRVARCNGGALAAAALSSSSLLYSFTPGPLTQVDLLVCASSKVFSSPVVGPALEAIQQELVSLSANSAYQTFPESANQGDLPVLYPNQLAQAIVEWISQPQGGNRKKRL